MLGIRLIVGLGNPGKQYMGNRHNIGFEFIDKLAAKYKVTLSLDNKFLGHIAQINCYGQAVWLLKPHTYMNLSGNSVLALSRFYKIMPEEILVIHDELAFVSGVLRLKLGGGVGGHNGLRDIVRVVGENYWRLRLGIGHPGKSSMVTNFVLSAPTLDESITINLAMNRALAAIEMLIKGEFNIVMKELHTS